MTKKELEAALRDHDDHSEVRIVNDDGETISIGHVATDAPVLVPTGTPVPTDHNDDELVRIDLRRIQVALRDLVARLSPEDATYFEEARLAMDSAADQVGINALVGKPS